jgi:hypothetical protein
LKNYDLLSFQSKIKSNRFQAQQYASIRDLALTSLVSTLLLSIISFPSPTRLLAPSVCTLRFTPLPPPPHISAHVPKIAKEQNKTKPNSNLPLFKKKRLKEKVKI